MTVLTDELRREMQAAGDRPLRLTDPENHREYVLLRAEVFDRLQRLIYDDSEVEPDAALPMVNELMAEDDSNDPLLDSYQRFTWS